MQHFTVCFLEAAAELQEVVGRLCHVGKELKDHPHPLLTAFKLHKCEFRRLGFVHCLGVGNFRCIGVELSLVVIFSLKRKECVIHELVLVAYILFIIQDD